MSTKCLSHYTGKGDNVMNYLQTFDQEVLKEILQDMVEKFGDDFLTYLDPGLDLRTQVVITDVDAFTTFLMSKYNA